MLEYNHLAHSWLLTSFLPQCTVSVTVCTHQWSQSQIRDRWSPRLGTMGSWTITKYWLQYYQYYNIITPFLSIVSSLLDIYFSFLLSLSDCCRLNVQEAADSQDSLSEIVWNGAETFYIEQTKWKWNQNIGEKITKTWKINRGNINTGKR